ncbi:hypothetical protein ACFVH6_44760 [Spirillospora sp. NPDC127200]
MAERRGRGPLAAGLALGVLATALAVAADGVLRDSTTLSTAEQPVPSTYPDGTAYSARLLQVDTLLLRRHRPYELWITRSGNPGYGHRIQIDDIDPDGGKPRITAAEWRPEGVRVHFASGHQAFVPARWFLGGR